MRKTTPQALAEDIMHRSRCRVRVGAVIADRHGIFAWSWNHEGMGNGMHAEHGAINRANPRRLEGASIYVAGFRNASRNPVCARPCEDCMKRIVAAGIKRVYYRDKSGEWKMEVAKWV